MSWKRCAQYSSKENVAPVNELLLSLKPRELYQHFCIMESNPVTLTFYVHFEWESVQAQQHSLAITRLRNSLFSFFLILWHKRIGQRERERDTQYTAAGWDSNLRLCRSVYGSPVQDLHVLLMTTSRVPGGSCFHLHKKIFSFQTIRVPIC